MDCTFGILKKIFFFFLNPIKIHLLEKIEDTFRTCAAIHNWLHNYDGQDDWKVRAGVITEEDVMVEYDPYDESNRLYSKTSSYHEFQGNFTRTQARRENRVAYRFDQYEKLVSERNKYEEC